MSLLAATRPDDWNLVLFLHILGAMALVGALVLAATSLGAKNLRLGFRTLLIVAIPSWIVMRVAAQSILRKEGLEDADPVPAWVDIGFITSEGSFVLLIAATVCAGIAASRKETGRLSTAALVLVGITLVAYLVAIWAMTAKPS
jgi:hypothetical protein